MTAASISVIIVLATALLAAIAIAVISYRSLRRNSQSVRLATEAVRQLASSNLAHRVTVPGSASSSRTGREILELADALNRMADAIGDTIQDLSGQRDRLSAVLATMADGVLVVSPQGVILMLNQAAQEMLNPAGPKAEGRRLIEVARDHQVHQLVSECMSTGQTQTGPVELLRPRRYLNVVASPLALRQAQDERVPGVLLTLRDLTRTRQMETSQREFVSNVSHELRNPLASVKALVETLEDGAVEQHEVALDFLRRIHHDVDRMSNLVNELLELSRLESGQLALQLNPVDLTPLFADVKSRFDRLAEERQVAINLSLPSILPRGLADEDRLRQVLINLVENAIKFTPSGGQITLCAQRKSPQPPFTKGGQAVPSSIEESPPYTKGEVGGFVEIMVQDTGVGISPQDLPHIFERFYKVDRSRHAGGTGLGLAIVKQIVEAHNGEVWAKSQEGAGSTLAFTLPIAE